MPYIMYSKFQPFICFIFDFMMFFYSVRAKFYPCEVVKSLFLVPKLLVFEPCHWVFACQLRAQNISFWSV